MDYFYSGLLGIIQGLTEFWPVSSSGHLVIAHQALDFGYISELGFDVALHIGTLLALLIFFSKDIYRYIVAFFKSFANWDLENNIDQRLAWFIIIGSVPAAVVGCLIADLAETIFRNLWLVASLLIGVGLLFIVFERIFQKIKDITQLKWSGAIIIGIAQALALVPGVSRSGITILAGLSQGLKRAAAARFSFLLSVPIIFGAGLKKTYDIANEGLPGSQWLMMGIGVVVSAVVGYFAIKFLLRFLETHSLNVFAYYRLLLGAAVIVYLLVS